MGLSVGRLLRWLGTRCRRQAVAAAESPPPVVARPKAEEPERDLAPKPLDRLPPGLEIREKVPPGGWSHFVYVAMPRLGQGDVNRVPAIGARYTAMFWPAVLANVKKEAAGGPGSFVLEKIAIGYALPVKNKRIIATRKNPSGADLGLFGGQIFDENEKFLDEAKCPAWTETMQVFDIPGIFLRGDEHKPLTIRHAVLANARTGQMASVVWLFDPEGQDGKCLPDGTCQVLPENFREDRVLNVKGDKIGLLGIPSPDAFAQVRIAQGQEIAFTPALKRIAGLKKFTNKSAASLEAALHEALGGQWPRAE